MRRLTLLLAAMGTALLLSAGLAFAATYDCTSGRACIGTDGPDTLNGSGGVDPYMDGRQGDDELFANEGEYASLQGDAFDAPDNDTTTDGDDLLKGGPGHDDMAGFGGSDELYGGARGDFIFAEESSANEGEDIVKGGRGSDYVIAVDEAKDTISCGKGKNDVAFFDEGIDAVANNCEHRNPDFEEFSRSAASTTDAGANAEKVSALRARH
jgi:Ca2+-binding RTX toxin-like protein